MTEVLTQTDKAEGDIEWCRLSGMAVLRYRLRPWSRPEELPFDRSLALDMHPGVEQLLSGPKGASLAKLFERACRSIRHHFLGAPLPNPSCGKRTRQDRHIPAGLEGTRKHSHINEKLGARDKRLRLTSC